METAANIILNQAFLCIEVVEGESIHEHSCHHRWRSFHPYHPARQFRDGRPATQGLTPLHTVAFILYDDVGPMVVSRTEDAPREPTRPLSELLWPAFTPPLAGILGGSPYPRLRTAPVGAGFSLAGTREACDIWDLSLYERDNFRHPRLRRCRTFIRAGTIPCCGRGRHRLSVSRSHYWLRPDYLPRVFAQRA